MPSLAGALTRLGLLALPAIPSPSYFATQAVTDTWSLTATLTASVDTAIPEAKAGSDAWSLTLTEAASSVTTYPSQKTQLALLALPGNYGVVTAKSVTSSQDIAGTDAWSLTWAEQPTDAIFIDTWDAWVLTATETAGLAVSQTFTASDSWSLTWLDVASVFAGGPIFQAVTDPWTLSFTETALVAATVDAADTWSISFDDAGVVDVVSDAKAGSDTWSLTFILETGFFTPVVELPILGSDEWKLIFAEVSSIVPFASDVGISRVLTVRAVNRVLRKQ